MFDRLTAPRTIMRACPGGGRDQAAGMTQTADGQASRTMPSDRATWTASLRVDTPSLA